MRSPLAFLRPRARRVRGVAFLLLVLQGLIAASPFLEPRNTGDLPRIHMEEKDAPHLDLHSDDTCALCSARTILAIVPLLHRPVRAAGHQPPPLVADAQPAASADALLHNFSRAPPSLRA